MSRAGRIYVGTSGWNYPNWRGRFYPKGLPAEDWLAHYAREFDTVEINNSFYRLPAPKTFREWKDRAPRGFIYAVKANRFITHMKKLKDSRTPVRRLLTRARRLGNHLGPILYQLPSHWKPDLERLKKFCAELPGELTHVIEFRERAWLTEEAFATLAEHGVSLCVHDMIARHPRRITGEIAYVRFHGAGSKYGGSYSRNRLRRWADWINQTAGDGYDVYAYFNNDRDGFAVRNARNLRAMLGCRRQDSARH